MIVIKKLLLVLTIIFACSICVYAHPGSLDENGGHYNKSTGEYHYHHGFPEHQHPNGECPYNFVDNANTEYSKNNFSPITTNILQNEKNYYFENLILSISIGIFAGFIPFLGYMSLTSKIIKGTQNSLLSYKLPAIVIFSGIAAINFFDYCGKDYFLIIFFIVLCALAIIFLCEYILYKKQNCNH